MGKALQKLRPPWYLLLQQAQQQRLPRPQQQQQRMQHLQPLWKQRMRGAGAISRGTSVAGGVITAAEAAAAAVGVAVVAAPMLWHLGGLGSALTAARLAPNRTLQTPTAVSVPAPGLAMV
jgi:hypothetical protein